MPIINPKFLTVFYKLYGDYREKIASESASEFIGKEKLKNEETEIFLNLTKNQKLMENYAKNFLEKTFKKRVSNLSAEFVLFLVIFLLNEENLPIILEFCLKRKFYFLCELTAFLVDPAKKKYLCQTAIKYFDNNYALEKIAEPILNKANLIIKLGKEFLELHTIEPLKNTEIREFNFSRKNYHNLIPPANTPKIPKKFKAFKAPESTWNKNGSLAKNLLKLKEANRKKADQLRFEAAKIPQRLTEWRKPQIMTDDILTPQMTADILLTEWRKPKFINLKKNVVIKGNLTTTLREASRLIKQQNSELKNIDDLIKGGLNADEFDKLEAQLKKDKELNQIELIEKNHLKGLLSYEEAILAKNHLKELNKEKMKKLKEEKQNLAKILTDWRKKEEEKIRQLVLKSNTIKLGAKDSQQKLIEKRQQNVKMQQNETKQLLEIATAQKKEELQKKIDLIQEIKTIDKIRCNFKEFDPTRVANYGLLCEMSIAELQDRLLTTKMEIEKELEEKRQKILKSKEDRRKMIENVEKMVEESKKNYCKKIVENYDKNSELMLKSNSDIVELRKQLEEKRKLRNFMK